LLHTCQASVAIQAGVTSLAPRPDGREAREDLRVALSTRALVDRLARERGTAAPATDPMLGHLRLWFPTVDHGARPRGSSGTSWAHRWAHGGHERATAVRTDSVGYGRKKRAELRRQTRPNGRVMA
jgi:hypothetical protein